MSITLANGSRIISSNTATPAVRGSTTTSFGDYTHTRGEPIRYYQTPPVAAVHPIEVGLELTFIPLNERTHEWRNKQTAEEYAALFNGALRNKGLDTDEQWYGSRGLVAKADIFRSVHALEGQRYNSWCIEVNGSIIVHADALPDARIVDVYAIAAELGLAPKVIKTNRRGVKREHPSGGDHKHLSTSSLWDSSSSFLHRLYLLEQNLCLDYANNPFIRWAFAQWFDDNNSLCAMDLNELAEIEKDIRKQGPFPATNLSRAVHDRCLSPYGIKQRMAATGKASYATYEFRFFDMPLTPADWHLQARFLAHWVSYHKRRIDAVFDRKDGEELNEEQKKVLEYPAFTLTAAQYRRLSKSRRYAQEQMVQFWQCIGLDWRKDYYDLCWTQHYEPRMAGGKFV